MKSLRSAAPEAFSSAGTSPRPACLDGRGGGAFAGFVRSQLFPAGLQALLRPSAELPDLTQQNIVSLLRDIYCFVVLGQSPVPTQSGRKSGAPQHQLSPAAKHHLQRTSAVPRDEGAARERVSKGESSGSIRLLVR